MLNLMWSLAQCLRINSNIRFLVDAILNMLLHEKTSTSLIYTCESTANGLRGDFKIHGSVSWRCAETTFAVVSVHIKTKIQFLFYSTALNCIRCLLWHSNIVNLQEANRPIDRIRRPVSHQQTLSDILLFLHFHLSPVSLLSIQITAES